MVLLSTLLLFVSASNAQINRVEYFFDTDPGFGLATTIPVTPATNIIDQNVSISLSATATGFHNLHIRSRDVAGKWSITNQVPFYKIASGPAANIDRVEYFVDTDPGFNQATAIPFTAATNVAGQAAAVSLSGIANGFHNLYIRSREVAGKWSVTNQIPFYKIASGPVSNIDRVEYFFDTDPGFGLGLAISIAPGTTISDQAAAVNLTTVSNGFHNLYLRSRDVSSKWSITNSVAFYKMVSPVPNNLKRVEYFIDTDPGFGLATQIPAAVSPNIADQAYTINIASLANGPHNLFVRSRDSANRWSITNQVAFQVGPPLPVSLLYFSAKVVNGQALLNWSTTTEQNSKHFLVERSPDGSRFTVIGTVAAAGQSNTRREYQFTDDLAALPASTSRAYYRIQMVDKDGSQKASPTVSVDINAAKTELVLLQNPVLQQALLQYTGTSIQKAALRIIDASGKTVLAKMVAVVTGSNQYTLETAALAKGVYAVQLISDSGKTTTIKMMKE